VTLLSLSTTAPSSLSKQVERRLDCPGWSLTTIVVLYWLSPADLSARMSPAAVVVVTLVFPLVAEAVIADRTELLFDWRKEADLVTTLVVLVEEDAEVVEDLAADRLVDVEPDIVLVADVEVVFSLVAEVLLADDFLLSSLERLAVAVELVLALLVVMVALSFAVDVSSSFVAVAFMVDLLVVVDFTAVSVVTLPDLETLAPFVALLADLAEDAVEAVVDLAFVDALEAVADLAVDAFEAVADLAVDALEVVADLAVDTLVALVDLAVDVLEAAVDLVADMFDIEAVRLDEVFIKPAFESLLDTADDFFSVSSLLAVDLVALELLEKELLLVSCLLTLSMLSVWMFSVFFWLLDGAIFLSPLLFFTSFDS